MDDGLRKIPRQLKLGNIFICSSKVGSQVNALKLPLSCKYLFDLLGKVLVFVFLVVEVFGTLRSIIDDLGNLFQQSVKIEREAWRLLQRDLLLVNRILSGLR